VKAERLLIVVVLVQLIAGCVGFDGRKPGFLTFSEQERSLRKAQDLLHSGNERQARELLEKVIIGVPTAGVSDEALFRLSLLILNDDGVKGSQRSHLLLKQLADKYPDSLWAIQSAPLLQHLEEYRDLRNRGRELRTLRELNLSLSRDNKEMRQNLERLKQLDLELEQRIKR
jgi:hypothetical protein